MSPAALCADSVPRDQAIDLAAAAICEAEAVFVTSGAGMGVDSGLPDFRGNQGRLVVCHAPRLLVMDA